MKTKKKLIQEMIDMDYLNLFNIGSHKDGIMIYDRFTIEEITNTFQFRYNNLENYFYSLKTNKDKDDYWQKEKIKILEAYFLKEKLEKELCNNKEIVKRSKI